MVNWLLLASVSLDVISWDNLLINVNMKNELRLDNVSRKKD